MPTVSIILPTYNRAHLLSRAIQSVLDQTYQDFELIIVDDGSTDNTEEIVKSFNDERIKYIWQGENKGVSAARNTGIKMAKGKYIAFQDSDDEWMPEKLEKQVRAFEAALPEVGIVYTGFFTVINDKKRYITSIGVTLEEGDIFSTLLKGNFIGAPTILIKRECFERVGMFDDLFPPMEDWKLLLKMSRHYQFKCIDEPLVTSYLQPDSISANQSALIKAFKLILETYFEDIKQDRRVLASYYFRLGNFLCPYGELSQGRSYLFRSIKTYPLDIKALGAFLASLFGQNIYKIVARSYRKLLR